mmetsp:Transcript_37135/g.71385  ORF Transcript_37135/g.71385 Transcript_37135/m.71385 type:complete len:258 (-) Transcript_37135:176-949(-)
MLIQRSNWWGFRSSSLPLMLFSSLPLVTYSGLLWFGGQAIIGRPKATARMKPMQVNTATKLDYNELVLQLGILAGEVSLQHRGIEELVAPVIPNPSVEAGAKDTAGHLQQFGKMGRMVHNKINVGCVCLNSHYIPLAKQKHACEAEEVDESRTILPSIRHHTDEFVAVVHGGLHGLTQGRLQLGDRVQEPPILSKNLAPVKSCKRLKSSRTAYENAIRNVRIGQCSRETQFVNCLHSCQTDFVAIHLGKGSSQTHCI